MVEIFAGFWKASAQRSIEERSDTAIHLVRHLPDTEKAKIFIPQEKANLAWKQMAEVRK